MNWRALILFFVLGAIVLGVSGCMSNEPQNASVRPWDSSEGWQGGALGGMNYQHE